MKGILITRVFSISDYSGLLCQFEKIHTLSQAMGSKESEIICLFSFLGLGFFLLTLIAELKNNMLAGKVQGKFEIPMNSGGVLSGYKK